MLCSPPSCERERDRVRAKDSMSHIFISYSHKDAKYVHKLQKALFEEGFDVWIDDRIDYGTEWPTVIQKHLDDCGAFIVVLTDNAYNSKWVQNELTRASRKGIPFFPLLLQGDPWLSVEATQYVDVTDGSLPPESFYQRLEGVIPRKSKTEIAQAQPPQVTPTPEPIQKKKRIWRWKIPVAIVAAFLVLFVVLLAAAYFFLPTAPTTSSYARSSELTGFYISSNSNFKFDKVVFSPDDTVYLSLSLTDFQAVGRFESRWYYLVTLFGEEKKIYLGTQQDNTSAVSDSILYNLTPPLLRGYYCVEVFKDDNLIGLKYFWVR